MSANKTISESVNDYICEIFRYAFWKYRDFLKEKFTKQLRSKALLLLVILIAYSSGNQKK